MPLLSLHDTHEDSRERRSVSGGVCRCSYVDEANPLYVHYHDTEWCIPSHDDAYLYEMFLLELFQAGLSWSLLLSKREGFRDAYEGFDPHVIAAYGTDDMERLMNDARIIRHRGKIEASITNAQMFLAIQQEFGSFDAYIWKLAGYRTHYEPLHVTKNKLSDALSKDLKARGARFAGSVTLFSYLQAVGVIDSHEPGCFLYAGPAGEHEERPQ